MKTIQQDILKIASEIISTNKFLSFSFSSRLSCKYYRGAGVGKPGKPKGAPGIPKFESQVSTYRKVASTNASRFIPRLVYIHTREGILEGLKFKSGLFKHISGPRLGATLIMNKNGLLFLICSSMTLRRPQISLDSIYFQEDIKNLKKE